MAHKNRDYKKMIGKPITINILTITRELATTFTLYKSWCGTLLLEPRLGISGCTTPHARESVPRNPCA
eukprot:COSAG01_NODE_38866_length_484_cov_0.787013_1_plen_67_part_01